MILSRVLWGQYCLRDLLGLENQACFLEATGSGNTDVPVDSQRAGLSMALRGPYICPFVLLCCETGFAYVAQAGPGLPPQCMADCSVPTQPVCSFLFCGLEHTGQAEGGFVK